MRAKDAAALIDHLFFVRDKILDAADDPAVPFIDSAPVTRRDLRSTLVHELDVEWSWRVRLSSADRTRFNEEDEELRPEDFASLAAIRHRWAGEETAARAWIRSLTDAELAGPCRTEADGGRHPFWFHVQHIYSHGIQQFADAATILSAAGRSPGELDFLEFVEQRLDRAAAQR